MNDVKITRLDHHGIVAGVFSELGFEKILNDLVGVDDEEKVTTGQAVKAMVLCGLGFTNRALMLTPQFFENLAVDSLIGPGVEAEDLNRFKLGRTLDALAAKGCESIFSILASHACEHSQINQSKRSLDTTSFSLTGQYDNEPDTEVIKVCRGYSKDHRPDLKQLVLELVVSQDGGIPLHMKTHSGNASDSKLFAERSRSLVKSLKTSAPIEAWVGDSKLYCADNAKHLSSLPFITRIPRTIKQEKELVVKALSSPEAWSKLEGTTNQYQSFVITHYDIEQRWLVVQSEEAKKRSRKTVTKAVKKESVTIDKRLFHFQAQRFACQDDARKAYLKLSKGLKYHQLKEPVWTELPVYEKAGRPNKESVPSQIKIQGHGEKEKRDDHIEALIENKACFVIGTAVKDDVLDDAEVIKTYKAQSTVETGFRFLKDPLFFTSSLFLKKPERLQALLMIMTIALLVYSIAQKRLRAALAENGETVPNQIKQPTQTPTMRWVFQCFEGVTVLESKGRAVVYGLNELRGQIIRLLNFHEVSKLYKISTG